MKKGNSGLIPLRHANSYKQPRKQEHFSYFQSLQQKLLQESDKLTNLIGIKSISSLQTRSANDSAILRPYHPRSQHHLFPPSLHDFQEDDQGQPFSPNLHGSLYCKKPPLNAYKSQFFQSGKEKQQMQRKLTYNLAHPNSQPTIPEKNSPCKSQKIAQKLKKTTSTTTSTAAIMKTMDKIKRMHSLNLNLKATGQSKPRSISIDDFQVLKYLEQGQFGTVYLSRHKETNFICAIKKIPKAIFLGEMRFIGQLIREIKIQSYLDHPNIVQLYSSFADEENLYLMLELCCGGNVYNSLKKEGRFGEERVRSIARQISHAIQFMHDSDIIHRDIKPQNILLHEGIVKVCDFGWSIHSPLMRDTRCGTPLYSSPQAIQKQQYDNKIDVWNIGILTYELLYGRVPFQIRTEEDLVKVVDEQIYFSKGVPISAEAKDFILKCLIKNPKDRFPMPKLVDHDFLLQGN